MDFTILFDRDHRKLEDLGTVAYSDVLYVPPGKAALLSMYNVVAGQELVEDPVTGKKTVINKDCMFIHKISYGRVPPAVFDKKCNELPDVNGEIQKLLAKRRVFFQPVEQDGCSWSLDACNNYALLPVPGFFMLKLTDPNQFDTAYVEYALLDVQDTITIPDAFKLGHMGCKK